MPNKKHEQQTNKKYRVTTRTIVLIVILGSLGFYLGISTLLGVFETNQKQNRLNNAGTLLDKIYSDLPKDEMKYTTVRNRDCVRESTKLSDGWLVCSQYIKLSGKTEDSSELNMIVSGLSRALRSVGGFKSIPVDQMTDFNDPVELSTHVVKDVDSNGSGCIVDYFAISSDHRLPEKQGEFELVLSCSETGLNKKIY